MIDRELIQWAVNEAASGDDTPDVDIATVMSYAKWRAQKFDGDVEALGVDRTGWLAGCLAHLFCLGVACGRAEVVDTDGSE